MRFFLPEPTVGIRLSPRCRPRRRSTSWPTSRSPRVLSPKATRSGRKPSPRACTAAPLPRTAGRPRGPSRSVRSGRRLAGGNQRVAGGAWASVGLLDKQQVLRFDQETLEVLATHGEHFVLRPPPDALAFKCLAVLIIDSILYTAGPGDRPAHPA